MTFTSEELASLGALPRDLAPLSDEEELAIRTLYDEFDMTSEPVSRQVILGRLKGHVLNANSLVSGETFGRYAQRTSNDDRYTPRLRATVRLWREEDLLWTSRLYRHLWETFDPAHKRQIADLEFAAICPDAKQRTRLAWLLRDERFASFHPYTNPTQGHEPQIYVHDEILEWPTLAEYLRRYTRAPRPDPTYAKPQAEVRLDAFTIRNYRSIKHAESVTLGNFVALAGPNETGKTTLLRALSFASRCAANGVRATIQQEGGMARVRRRGASRDEAVEFDLRLLVGPHEMQRIAHYQLALDAGPKTPVRHEKLWLRVESQDKTSQMLVEQKRTSANVSTDDVGTPAEVMYLAAEESALAALTNIQTQRTAIAIREGFGSWSFFNFEPGDLRHGSPRMGTIRLSSYEDSITERHRRGDFLLREDGSNLPAAIADLAANYPEAFAELASAFKECLPLVEGLTTDYPLDSSTPTLQLREAGLTDPFTQVDLSDGTLRLLAILYLAYHPNPPSVICVEEPENALYPLLIDTVVEHLRALSTRAQVIITTHSVTLLNRLDPNEVLYVGRNNEGTFFRSLADDEAIKAFAVDFGMGDQLRMGRLDDRFLGSRNDEEDPD